MVTKSLLEAFLIFLTIGLAYSPGWMFECPEFCSEPSGTELAWALGWGCALTAPSVAGCAALPSSAGDACGRRVSSPDCGDVG